MRALQACLLYWSPGSIGTCSGAGKQRGQSGRWYIDPDTGRRNIGGPGGSPGTGRGGVRRPTDRPLPAGRPFTPRSVDSSLLPLHRHSTLRHPPQSTSFWAGLLGPHHWIHGGGSLPSISLFLFLTFSLFIKFFLSSISLCFSFPLSYFLLSVSHFPFLTFLLLAPLSVSLSVSLPPSMWSILWPRPNWGHSIVWQTLGGVGGGGGCERSTVSVNP